MPVETRPEQLDRPINLDTWEEFEEKLKELRKESGPRSSGLLFREKEWRFAPYANVFSPGGPNVDVLYGDDGFTRTGFSPAFGFHETNSGTIESASVHPLGFAAGFPLSQGLDATWDFYHGLLK